MSLVGLYDSFRWVTTGMGTGDARKPSQPAEFKLQDAMDSVTYIGRFFSILSVVTPAMWLFVCVLMATAITILTQVTRVIVWDMLDTLGWWAGAPLVASTFAVFHFIGHLANVYVSVDAIIAEQLRSILIDGPLNLTDEAIRGFLDSKNIEGVELIVHLQQAEPVTIPPSMDDGPSAPRSGERAVFKVKFRSYAMFERVFASANPKIRTWQTIDGMECRVHPQMTWVASGIQFYVLIFQHLHEDMSTRFWVQLTASALVLVVLVESFMDSMAFYVTEFLAASASGRLLRVSAKTLAWLLVVSFCTYQAYYDVRGGSRSLKERRTE